SSCGAICYRAVCLPLQKWMVFRRRDIGADRHTLDSGRRDGDLCGFTPNDGARGALRGVQFPGPHQRHAVLSCTPGAGAELYDCVVAWIATSANIWLCSVSRFSTLSANLSRGVARHTWYMPR